eukprot:52338-Rhodomonas_salina.1
MVEDEGGKTGAHKNGGRWGGGGFKSLHAGWRRRGEGMEGGERRRREDQGRKAAGRRKEEDQGQRQTLQSGMQTTAFLG